MLIRALAILALLSVPAFAQDASLRYASFPSLATALALSQSAWQAVRCTPQPSCDPAQITQFNYPIITLVNGNSAIVIHSGDVYQGEHLSLPNGKSFNLTANQIAALQTRAQVGTQLPDILPLALVNSRLTQAQTTAISTYVASHATFKANYQALTAGPIDLEGPLLSPVTSELLSAGILTAADVSVIFAPQTTAAVNP